MRPIKDIKSLLSKRELALVQEDQRFESPRRIKEKVKLLRELRDKYRDLARRQKIGLRGKAMMGPLEEGTENRRTIEKADFFAEALELYRERLQEIPEDDPGFQLGQRRKSG